MMVKKPCMFLAREWLALIIYPVGAMRVFEIDENNAVGLRDKKEIPRIYISMQYAVGMDFFDDVGSTGLESEHEALSGVRGKFDDPLDGVLDIFQQEHRNDVL